MNKKFAVKKNGLYLVVFDRDGLPVWREKPVPFTKEQAEAYAKKLSGSIVVPTAYKMTNDEIELCQTFSGEFDDYFNGPLPTEKIQ